MTAVDATALTAEELQAKAWDGFVEGDWQKDIDVRDFIQKNYTPYTGDESFLADATDKTKHLWKYLDDNYLAVERKQRVYDVDTHIPAGIDAFPAGYIESPEVDNVVVGLQTDVPCKRAMMPNGGWRMVEQAIKEAGKEPSRRSRRSSPSTARPTTTASSASTPRTSRSPATTRSSPVCRTPTAAAASSATTAAWPCTASPR